jgi:midasin (ATPase involved in ribosome maturation)
MKRLSRRYDGPLIRAMREGHIILLDEISLAEDSVLERLNSVLEPSRTITLAERGGEVNRDVPIPMPCECLAMSDAPCICATR